MNKKDEHYVDNEKFTEAVQEYADNYRELKVKFDKLKSDEKFQGPRISEYMGSCIFAIANKVAMRPNFIGYTYRDDMVGDGIENTLKYIHNFDGKKVTGKPNAFAYATQIIWFAFLRRIESEKKQGTIKQKCLENMNVLIDVSHSQENDDSILYFPGTKKC